VATNPQARVLELIRMFNNNETVCLESLKENYLWLDKSDKTIRRDIDVIKEYFPDSFTLIRGEKGAKSCYKAVTKKLMNNILDKDSLAFLVQTFNLAQRNNILSNLDIDSNDKRILETKLKKTKDCYFFISKPFESKNENTLLFDKIEKAITYKRYAKITYVKNNDTTTHRIKPYKILFMNENFYLACENSNEKYLFSMFRISNLKLFEVESKSFQNNYDIE